MGAGRGDTQLLICHPVSAGGAADEDGAPEEDAGSLHWDKSTLDEKSTLAGAPGTAPISTIQIFSKDGAKPLTLNPKP